MSKDGTSYFSIVIIIVVMMLLVFLIFRLLVLLMLLVLVVGAVKGDFILAPHTPMTMDCAT